MHVALFLTVLLIAACGLIYELVAGALASYLLGDSITQFSTVIGSYLFAMGVGSWLSRFLTRGLASRFVAIQLMVAVVGGLSSTLLFLAFAYTDAFRVLLYVVVVTVGVLVGLEIPLLMRLLRSHFEFKDVVSNVLTFDYLGALGAALLFPIVLVPSLGMVRTAILFGMVNAAVALWSTYLFRNSLEAVGDDVTLRVEVVAREREVEIEVSDDGPGISAELAEKVFEPFVSSKARGHGLGLALASRVVGFLGGGLELVNPGEAGAKFRVRIPRAPAGA